MEKLGRHNLSQNQQTYNTYILSILTNTYKNTLFIRTTSLNLIHVNFYNLFEPLSPIFIHSAVLSLARN